MGIMWCRTALRIHLLRRGNPRVKTSRPVRRSPPARQATGERRPDWWPSRRRSAFPAAGRTRGSCCPLSGGTGRGILGYELDGWARWGLVRGAASGRAGGVARTGRGQALPAGRTLFNEGDLSDWVVIVLEGRVKVSAATADGKEVILAIRGPGELLGDLFTIDAHPRSATATAIDAVDCRIISSDEFQLFLTARPQATLAFLQVHQPPPARL